VSVPQYTVCVPNILYVYPIYRMCTQYTVCVPNILYVYPIYCMCTQYTVCVPNILHTIADMRRDDRETKRGRWRPFRRALQGS
jgi:hypothetical protein